MESMIILKNAVKEYKGPGGKKIRALDIDHLDISKGDFTVILGASGSGKSTLLNVIGAQSELTAGEISIGGEKYSDLSDKGRAVLRARRFGFVFQNYGLVPDYTVYGNIELALAVAKSDLKGVEKKKRISECASSVGISDLLKKKASELSGGEQQRCAIARAMVNDPDVILADEPTGALDSKTGHEIIELLKKLNDKGKTVIVVTHNTSVCDYANRVIRLHDGKIESVE